MIYINENKKLKLISPIPPSVNHYLGWRAMIKGGKPIVMSYKKAGAKKYQKEFIEYIIEEVKKQGWVMSDNKFQHYYVDAIFYFPRIDQDANNCWKCMLDAISDSKCVWIDDTQACERVKAIYYDGENPRIELEIYKVDYIGIFKNRAMLEGFESNCVQCNRYRKGRCSLLVKSKEGRIQKEIINGICQKYKKIAN